MPDGILVRAWRYLFARDSHVECAKAIQHERLARQWQRESDLRLIEQLQGKLLEMADPGINHRFNAKPNERKAPIKVDLKNEPEMLPGLN